jgi:hypothetical protein
MAFMRPYILVTLHTEFQVRESNGGNMFQRIEENVRKGEF